jgi:hypothetical protein
LQRAYGSDWNADKKIAASQAFALANTIHSRFLREEATSKALNRRFRHDNLSWVIFSAFAIVVQ